MTQQSIVISQMSSANIHFLKLKANHKIKLLTNNFVVDCGWLIFKDLLIK